MKYAAILFAATSLAAVVDAITFEPDAKKFLCPSTPETPLRLDSLSLDKGSNIIKHILLEPHYNPRELCTLTRVNDEFATQPIYIPIARAYDDNPNWNKSAGRYVSTTKIICGTADSAPDGNGYAPGDFLCQITLDPPLSEYNDGYYLTTFAVPDTLKDERAIVANFLEKVTFGPTMEEINNLYSQYQGNGPMALARWLKNALAKPITSHRVEFRKRLHPRAVESYIYGIPGPRPCEKNARFRRFAFTYMDVEISRGSDSPADNTGHPYTKMKIETIQINGVNHWAVKFGDHLRTVLTSPMQYYNENSGYIDPNGAVTDLLDDEYTLCNAEEVMGSNIGDTTFEDIGTYSFQILVGAKCTSSYTTRGGQDYKGDGSIDGQLIKFSGSLVRSYDSAQCNLKCKNADYVRYVKGGNPEVNIPSGFDKTTISYLDLTKLPNPASQLVNLNADLFHDSSWRITANLETSFVSDPPSCKDENGATIPDAAGLSYNDYFSTGRGKYNLDAPIFAKMPNNKWALHDYRSKFQANTLENPLADAGGAEMKRARRAVNGVPYGDGTPDVDLVTRCSNVEANIFNEPFCKISYDENACETTPAAPATGITTKDRENFNLYNPTVSYEDASKYIPKYAGRAVVVCGSENEAAPDQSDDDHYAVSNRKLNSHRISYGNQIRTVWMEQALYAVDQPCQKLAWQLSKIFAYSNGHGEEEIYLNTYDWAFVASCDSTYAEVVKKMTHNVQMAEQLTFIKNKAAATEWHRSGTLNYPDENYARENLQLHQIGLPKLHEDGSPKLDKFGKHIPNYTQQNIFAASKIFTGLSRSTRRGNYNDLDRTTASYLDPLKHKYVHEKDWFPKIGFDESYIGDQYPLCADLPRKHFLKKGAKFVALGGNNLGRYHHHPDNYYLDDEVQKLQLDSEVSSEYGMSPLFAKLCRPKSFQNPTSSLTQGNGQAEYISSIGAPKCVGMASRCDSLDFLEGRYSSEPNDSNTIDSCSDGNAEPMLTGQSNLNIQESVKRIVVEAVKGSNMRGGSLVSIQATVIAYDMSDKVDFYYTHDAANPDWKFITTVSPTVGEQTVTLPRLDRNKITFRLPICNADHCDVAVRVALRSSRYLHTGTNPYQWRAGNQSNDGSHKPATDCAKDPYDDTDDLVFQVLPTAKLQDMCDFQGTITLNENLSYCTPDSLYDECHVDTIRVVEVLPGVYYEYVRLPCVNMPFIKKSDTTKVVANWDMATAMCADKRLASATSTCCGGYADRHPRSNDSANSHWADILSEYRGERLTYDGNSIRCIRWVRTKCDPNSGPSRIGPFTTWRGQCQHRMSCRDSSNGGHGRYLESIWYHWTSLGCEIKVKVDVEGMIAVIHVPFETDSSETDSSKILPLVEYSSTVSFFSVHWDKSNVAVGKLPYPHHSDNACDGGEIRDDFCFCGTTLLEEHVFNSLPTKAQVLDELHIGAFDPTVFDTDDDPYTYTLHEESEDVKVYTRASSSPYYSSETIFRVVNDYNGDPLYLKNVRSVVSVCNGSFKFRNAPTFYNVANPDIVSANQEMEAYLQAVINHDSAPPFTCISLMKTFGFSNPSPSHVLSCSQAFKTGIFLFSNPEIAGQTLSFGSGKRSDMPAILAAIVLPPESVSPSVILDPASGGVQDPFEKLLHVMRSLKLKRTPHHRRSDGLLQGNAVSIIGSGCYGPKDQFSFYSPDFVPPGNHLEAGLTSPAGELATLNGIVGVSNALYALVRFGLSACGGGIGIRWGRGFYDTCGNHSDGLYANTVAYLSYSTNEGQSASDVVNHLALLLTSGRLSPENRNIIEAQFTLSYTASGSIMEALQVATILAISTPEFHTFNTLAMSGAARTATPPKPKDESVPYKAIVHINLFGGMDSMNMLIPHPDGCSSLYDEYRTYRGDKNSLTKTTIPNLVRIDATSSNQPCTYFGVNSALNNLASIYNDGDGLFFANIGHLQKLVNRYNFQGETTAQLFSHFSMRDEMFKVDAFGKMDGSGILGRMADVFSLSMGIGQTGVGSSPTILKGDPGLANPVNVVKASGLDAFYQGRDICKEAATQLNAQCTRGSENSWRSILLEKMQELNAKTKATSSLQAEFWSQSFINALSETESIRSLLNDASGGASIPDNDLGRQLDMVFRLITINEARNVNRDFFAVELGGFDTHFEMFDLLASKFDIINSAIMGFRNDLKGAVLSDGSSLWDKVTVVMSSEFGRTVSPNNSGGTDHGWGGHSFMMGGSVKGGQILGEHPSTYNPADTHNTGRGVWIPTTSWESQWYAIVQWAGITDQAAIDYVLPNAPNFGCNLYAEVDLFEGGTASLSGCGGCVIQLRQSFHVSEPRVLIPDEQTAFCGVVVASVAPVEIRCFIKDQILSPLEVPVGNAIYEIAVDYEINFDPTVINCAEIVTENIDTDKFRADAASILILMDEVVIQQAEVVLVLAPTMSPSTSMEPSQAVMASGHPSLSSRPSMATYIAPYYGHKFVGDGKCIGVLGGNVQFQKSTYNYLEFQSSLFVAAVRCPAACAPYRAYNQYRGFEFKSEICRCLFDSGTDLNQVLIDNGGLPHTTVVTNKARGIVIGSDDSSDLACYEAALPEAPETVDKFEYIGFGECWDASKATYDYFAITSSEASTSAVKCGEACSLSNYPLSKGFFTKKGIDCHCLFEDGVPVSGITIADNGAGVGQIVSSNYVEGHCYKALPAPTNFPTKMPTPKPTPRPTKNPTPLPSSIPSGVPSSQPSLTPSKSVQPSSEPSLAPSVSFSPSVSFIPTSENVNPQPSSEPSKSSSPSDTPSSQPSLTPSKSAQPSSEPSLAPSVSVSPSVSFIPTSGNPPPSSEPSKSSSPSDTPSSQPSLTPSKSAQPSSEPSNSFKPSLGPSLSPSKSSAPSTGPSSDPSLSPSKSSRPSGGAPVFGSNFVGIFTIDTTTQDASTKLMAVSNMLSKLTERIRITVCSAANANSSVKSCVVRVLKVNGISVGDPQRNRRLRSRSLVYTTDNLVVEYQMLLEAICTDSNCSDAQSVGNALYALATGELKDRLADGTFASNLKTDLSATAEVNALLDSAVLYWNFGDVVIPILNLLSHWYPDWNGGEIRCKNDGNAPNFMSLNGWWHESSKDACCRKYFMWAYDECAGQSAEYVPGYYPLWGDIEPRCGTGNPPNYMRDNPKGWIHKTIEDCCKNNFGWDPNCVANSGGAVGVDLTATMYYADWERTNTCVNDGKAPGYMKTSPKLWMYDTLLKCCKAHYFWGEEYAKCMTPAGANPPTSSPIQESWYVDWVNQICVKSCEGPPPCGGIHKTWNILYSTQAKCCEQHLWWKKGCVQHF